MPGIRGTRVAKIMTILQNIDEKEAGHQLLSKIIFNHYYSLYWSGKKRQVCKVGCIAC